jgi:hypothetical protein
VCHHLDLDPDDNPAYGNDGVDVTLIRWFLTLTPAERLTALGEFLNDTEQIRKLKTEMTRYSEVLRILLKHDVDFIVVGGISAVLNGAPITTFDLDIVHSREPGNIARLLTALDDLVAEYRDLGGRKLKPTETHLRSHGHQLLMTRFGTLNVRRSPNDA